MPSLEIEEGTAIEVQDGVLHIMISTEFAPKLPMGFVEPLTAAVQVFFIAVLSFPQLNTPKIRE